MTWKIEHYLDPRKGWAIQTRGELSPEETGLKGGNMANLVQPLGTNIVAEINGTKLKLEIDLDKTFGQSKSGKSITVATTGGNVTIPGTTIKLGLNAYK